MAKSLAARAQGRLAGMVAWLGEPAHWSDRVGAPLSLRSPIGST